MKTFWAIKDKKGELVLNLDNGFINYGTRRAAEDNCIEDSERPVKVRIVEVEE